MSNIITNFSLDLSNLPAGGEVRNFTITGSVGAEFILEIKNEDNHYYNFVTSSFQSTKANLEAIVVSGTYKQGISFPTITDNDQYDIYLYAKPGTRHNHYSEVRFLDGSLDINSSAGSNSLMMQKVIYQYTALTLTLNAYSAGSTVSGATTTNTITTDRGKSKSKVPFSLTFTAAATAAYRVLKQPVPNDVLSFLTPTVGSEPETLPGENIYPAISDTDTVDGVIAGGGSVIKVVMDNNVATNLVVGDKITAATSTSTVNGAISSGVNVNMDHTVTTIMAVGDQVTAPTFESPINSKLVTVAALSVGGDTGVFALSEAIALSDGMALIFSPKCNRSLTTVAALNPDTDNVKEFSMSQNIGLVDGVTLSFSNQVNYRWPLNNIIKITPAMILGAGTNVIADTVVSDYRDTITLFAGTNNEQIITNNEVPALDTKNQTPTVVNGEVTVQPGNVIFNKQQPLALAGDSLKIGGYGEAQILNVHGYDVRFSNLAMTLSIPSTTTTEAISGSATIAVADREGIINNVSRVAGIGINSYLQNPLITTGAGLDGAGDWIMDAIQTLESGITLTVENTGRVATITGDIEIIKAGNGNATLSFDVDKLLSNSAPS